MNRVLAGVLALSLSVPVAVTTASPAYATPSGIEISLDENELIVVGHPSSPGATDAQVSGDIVITTEGSSYVVYVDEDLGGGAQLWSTDPACSPATGNDVVRVTCAIPDPDDEAVYIDLEGIDERGSGRLFVVVGDVPATFIGSPYADEFYGGDGGNYFEGGAGADYFVGGEGEDVAIGGPGPDGFDVSEDKASDFVDCNDDSSRGTDQATGGAVNRVEWDPKYDEVMDCGFPGAPRGLTRPVIEKPFIGAAVGATAGTWEGSGLRYLYTWYLCPAGTAAAAARLDCVATAQKEGGSTYTPKPADEGKILYVEVAAKNNFGYFAMLSDASDPISKPTGPTVIYLPQSLSDAAPKVGTPAKFHTGLWETKKGDTFQYVIEYCYTLQSGNQRCRTRTSGTTSAGTTVSYTPIEDDRDARLRITVTGVRKVKTGSSYSQLKTSATSLPTMTIPKIRLITIPDSWEPKQVKPDTYRFTKESVLDSWAATNRKQVFGFDLNIVRVGLADIRTSKKYAGLRKYLPDLPANDGAILSTNPGFRDDLKGYPGITPRPVLTVVVYDKLRDLDDCAVAVSQPDFLNALRGGPLFDATSWLTTSRCPSWRIEWSQAESPDTAARVESVRVDKSVADGVATNTIVLTAAKPRVQNLFMTVTPLSYAEAQQYPDTVSLTWDGDAKAGLRTSFRVWPMLAATGQALYGAVYGAIEVYDTDGARVSTWEMNQLNTGGRLDLRPTGVSAVFSSPGTARVLVRIIDSSRQLREVFMDIPVRAPSGVFATLDGRCWEWTGTTARNTAGLSCPAYSAPVNAVATYLRATYKGIGDRCLNDDAYCVMRQAHAREGASAARSNPGVSISLVNATFSVGGVQTRGLLAPRASCEWWDLVCKVVDLFTPKKAKVAVRPYRKPSAPPPPKAPPGLAETLSSTATISPGTSLLGVTDAGGCTQVGAGLSMGGCPGVGGVDLAKVPADPSALINLDGAGLINLDGAGLINLDGAGLINLDGAGLINLDGAGFQGVSVRVVPQSAGSLSVPVSAPLIGAGSLN